MVRHGIDATKALITPGILFEGMGFQYVGPVDGHDVAGAGAQLLEAPRHSTGRCWSTPSPPRGRATTRPSRTRPPAATASPSSTSPPASRSPRSPRPRPTPTSSPRRSASRWSATRAWWPSPRPCWRAPASSSASSASRTGPTTWASPSSTPSPSRPAWPARGCGRWWPSTPPSCSAPTTRSSTTWRCSACRSPSRSTAAAWWAPTARPTRAPSTSPTCGCVPNLVVMAPSDENELRVALATSLAPRRAGGLPLPARLGGGRCRSIRSPEAAAIGKARVLRKPPGKPDVLIVAGRHHRPTPRWPPPRRWPGRASRPPSSTHAS